MAVSEGITQSLVELIRMVGPVRDFLSVVSDNFVDLRRAEPYRFDLRTRPVDKFYIYISISYIGKFSDVVYL